MDLGKEDSREWIGLIWLTVRRSGGFL